MNEKTNNVIRLTAWSAIVGGLLAYANVAFVLMVAGQDMGMILHGAAMLSLPPGTRDLYRWAMLADILGFYLPLLVIGGYLWHSFREEAKAWGDMAALAILLYVVLGVSGAAMLQAILNPLAHLYAGGDDSVRTAAATAWTAVAHGSQKGLWWCEGPVVLIWGLIAGNQLKKAGWGRSLLLKIVAWLYGLFFLFGFFPGLWSLTELVETAAVLLFPLWMILFGGQLLFQRR